MLIPGVPVVYSGTELALEGVNDPGCRATYPTELSADQRSALEFSTPWMHLRGTSKALSHGGIEVIELKNHAMIFERAASGQSIRVLVNTGYRDELLNTDVSGTWLDINHKPVELGFTVPQRSLFYRKSD
jgi:alpha-glucosidase